MSFCLATLIVARCGPEVVAMSLLESAALAAAVLALAIWYVTKP